MYRAYASDKVYEIVNDPRSPVGYAPVEVVVPSFPVRQTVIEYLSNPDVQGGDDRSRRTSSHSVAEEGMYLLQTLPSFLQAQPLPQGSRADLEKTYRQFLITYASDIHQKAKDEWKEFLDMAPHDDDIYKYTQREPLHIPLFHHLFHYVTVDPALNISVDSSITVADPVEVFDINEMLKFTTCPSVLWSNRGNGTLQEVPVRRGITDRTAELGPSEARKLFSLTTAAQPSDRFRRMNVNQLKDELRLRRLKLSGLKETLVERLVEYEASRSSAASNGAGEVTHSETSLSAMNGSFEVNDSMDADDAEDDEEDAASDIATLIHTCVDVSDPQCDEDRESDRSLGKRKLNALE